MSRTEWYAVAITAGAILLACAFMGAWQMVSR